MKEIRGVITAMATPFDEDGAVDEAAALEAGDATCSSTARTGW